VDQTPRFRSIINSNHNILYPHQELVSGIKPSPFG